MASMITTAAWVPRGFAAPFPQKYNFDDAEFERIADLAKLQLDDANEDLEEAQAEGNEEGNVKTQSSDPEGAQDDSNPTQNGGGDIDINDADLKEYDLAHYDDDEEEVEGQRMDMFGNIKSLAYYESNKEDPYITIPDEEDGEDEDREELQILATDNLILAAKVEDELAHLEVYVYEDEADNLYVHHDIMLPAIPLCVEWLDLPVSKPGVEKDSTANFAAIGTMDPDIEVWDLDTVDCMYPNAILGQGGNPQDGEKKKKKKKKSKKANDAYHVDAVLSLAANRKHRNLLASASADKTVKLWDLHTSQCAKSYSYHTDKVCSLAWHSVESTVLLSGSYDRTVAAADMRAPEAEAPRWGVESDVENVRWDPHDPNYFYISTENGMVYCNDIRNIPSSPSSSKQSLWKLQAHDESVSSFDINAHVPGFMATGSSDKTVKLWNIQPTGPAMVVSRNLDIGRVFSTTFAPDAEVGFRLAVAGSKGTMHIWDTSTNSAVRKAFAHKMSNKLDDKVEERMIRVRDDESSDDDEEGEAESMDED
ncbi:WD40 repeat-like protein [Xylariaceae sp. FL0804]|nr:WD40 repeat-like protein [Xylariaceae sp. FL0804]